MHESVPHLVDANGRVMAFKRIGLREAGRDEEFLEACIAAHPELLGLDPLALRLSGKFVAFRQLRLTTPTNREVFPDIIFLTELGEVVVVEVKLRDNPELRDRRVIAQVIEYAASLPLLDEEDLGAMFSSDSKGKMPWSTVIAEAFPEHPSPSHLADVLLSRLQSAQLHLVIATDGAPEGLREMVRSVGQQAALGAYTLHVSEIQAYRAPGDEAQLLLFPQVPIETEIVATTMVQVSYPKGEKSPSVVVTTQSAAELKDSLRGNRKRAVAAAPELEAVVSEYNARAPKELQLEGNGRTSRQVLPPRWPGLLHYELLHSDDSLGVELHIEDEDLRPLQQPMKALVDTLSAAFPRVSWDPKWSRERGRIRVPFPLSASPSVIAEGLESFIAATRSKVEAELAAKGLFEE